MIANGLAPYTINVVVSNVLSPSKIVGNYPVRHKRLHVDRDLHDERPFMTDSPVRANVVLEDSNSMTVNSIYTTSI